MTPKFKAITTSGQWVEGQYYYCYDDNKHIINEIIDVSHSATEHAYTYQEKHTVIPETVCVGVEYGNATYFTGDTYKLWCDSHGKLGHAKKDFNVVVIYDEKDAQFKFQDIVNKNYMWAFNSTDFNCVLFQREITGNIHDHLIT